MASIGWAILVERDDGAGGLTLVAAYSAEGDVTLVTGGSFYGDVATSVGDVKQLEVNRKPWSDTLEINIRALPGSMDIEPLDVITIWLDVDGAGDYQPRAAGYVVECPGAGDSANIPRRIRALGLTNYLRYVGTGTNAEYAAGQAVEDVASAIVAASDLPQLGISAILTDTTGVTITGKTNPDSADLLQVLEGLASIAASGATDIRVYVGATLGHFIRFTDPVAAADATEITLDESSDDVRVSELQIKAQRRQTRVVWILGDGTHRYKQFDDDSPVSLDTPDIRTYTVDSGETPVQTVVLEPPESQQVFIPAADYSDPTEYRIVVEFPTQDIAVVESGVGVTADTAIPTSDDVSDGDTSMTLDSLPDALSAGDVLISNDINSDLLTFQVDSDFAASGGSTVITGRASTRATPWNSALNNRNMWRYSRALDGSRTGYVEFQVATSDVGQLRIVTEFVNAVAANGYAGFVYDYEVSGEAQFFYAALYTETGGGSGNFPEVYTGTRATGGGINAIDAAEGADGVSLVGDRAAEGAAAGAFTGLDIQAIAGSGTAFALRLYEALPIKIDTAALDALAEREFRSAELSSVRVSVNGYVEPPESLNLTLTDGTTITGASVSTVRFLINGEDDRTELIVGEREASQIIEQGGNYIARDTQATVRGAKLGGRKKR